MSKPLPDSLWPAAVASQSDPSESVYWWLVRLRWIAVAGVATILMLAGPVLGKLPTGSTPWLWTVVAALTAYNAALSFVGPRREVAGLSSYGVQIVVDCLALAGFVHLAGGVENPFLLLFVLHVVNANIVLERRGALRVLVLAIALIAAIVLGEGSGLFAHHCLESGGALCTGTALDVRTLAFLGGLALTLIASSLFTRFLTSKLRQGQRSLVATVAELEVEKDRLGRARAAVETERSRLQAIIDCMWDAVTLLDLSGTVLYNNQRARELWRAGSPAADDPVFANLLEDAARGSPPRAPLVFRRNRRIYEAAYSLVRNSRRETLGVTIVARDVTDLKEAEKRRMRDEQMSVVGKLAAAVAHEINNPIGVIFLYSQHALAMLPEDDPVRKHLETIRRNADGCRKIVGELLNMARPRKPECLPVDLRQLCREIVDSVQPLAERVGAHVSCARSTSVVPILANADAGMLHQTVLNLAINAIEAAGRGGEVTIGAYETQDGAETARAIEVRDNGDGIAPELLERIFQPYFTTKHDGTGLGLSVAESIARSHGGRIDVESRVGGGSVFRVVIPERRDADAVSHPRRRNPGAVLTGIRS